MAKIEKKEVESEAKLAFQALIEKYKAQNPKKYAVKEKAFLAKLGSL